jgi:hypothetical protein
MMVLAREYRTVINNITGSREFKLREYELSEDEWLIIDQLIAVLKVSGLNLTEGIY